MIHGGQHMPAAKGTDLRKIKKGIGPCPDLHPLHQNIGIIPRRQVGCLGKGGKGQEDKG